MVAAPEVERERFETLLPLARSQARRYEHAYHVHFGDFLTDAMLGAWRAAQTWDETGGKSLHSWGWLKISGAIIDAHRTDSVGSRCAVHLRRKMVSLDELLHGADATSLADLLPDHAADCDYQAIDDHDVLACLCARMDPDDWDILSAYYLDDETQASIGRRHGVTESRICQRLPTILRKARLILADTP